MITQYPALVKSYNYYIGKQPIMNKTATDVGKPNNKVCVNYCYQITNTYNGYITGMPISYSSDNDITDIMDILKYNDAQTEDSELLKNALIYGKAFEVCYIDEDAKQRMACLSPLECIDIYDDTISQNLKYIIRFYSMTPAGSMEQKYYVDVYDDTKIYHYQSTAGYSSLTFLGDELHYYKQVPITVFNLNTENKSIYAQVESLQDAYNELVSSEVDSFQSWADAYLILKGVVADGEDLDNAKEKRAFMIDSDAEISYLTKNVSDTQVENMLKNIDEQIYRISNTPNFTDDRFATASGISIRYKMIGFENAAANIEANMRKALQKRIELFTEVLHLVNGEDVWRDITIKFTRNIPVDLSEVVNTITALNNIVSNKTLLSLLPFVKDPEYEEELLLKQLENEKEISPFYQASLDYAMRTAQGAEEA